MKKLILLAAMLTITSYGARGEETYEHDGSETIHCYEIGMIYSDDGKFCIREDVYFIEREDEYEE